MDSPISGSSASLRASGFVRYIGAAFLSLWLVGWVIGEVFAVGFLLMLIRSIVGSAAGAPRPVPGGEWIVGGAAAFVLLFILFWLTLWTFGGFAAINELLRSLAGEDLIAVQPAGVELTRRAGPFRRVRIFNRAVIRRVRLRRHDKAVVIDTGSGTEVITKFGTPDERKTITDWLRRQLSLPEDGARVDAAAPPPGWIFAMDGGTTRLTRLDPRTRRTGAVISWLVAALTGLICFASIRTGAGAGSTAIALVLTLLVGWWAAWVTWAHREWVVQHGQLISHRRFATWQSERAFKSARLEVEQSTDSDNDDRYELKVIDEQGRKTIASSINDDAEVVDLGRWLAARTGFRLTLPHGMQPRRTAPVTDDEMR